MKCNLKFSDEDNPFVVYTTFNDFSGRNCDVVKWIWRSSCLTCKLAHVLSNANSESLDLPSVMKLRWQTIWSLTRWVKWEFLKCVCYMFQRVLSSQSRWFAKIFFSVPVKLDKKYFHRSRIFRFPINIRCLAIKQRKTCGKRKLCVKSTNCEWKLNNSCLRKYFHSKGLLQKRTNLSVSTENTFSFSISYNFSFSRGPKARWSIFWLNGAAGSGTESNETFNKHLAR